MELSLHPKDLKRFQDSVLTIEVIYVNIVCERNASPEATAEWKVKAPTVYECISAYEDNEALDTLSESSSRID